MKNLNAIGHLLLASVLLSSTHFSSHFASCAPNASPAPDSGALKPNCATVKELFRNEGFYSDDKPKSDSGNLRICRREKTCCTKGVEFNLNVKSKSEFQQKFRHLINNSIESTLISWAEQFNSYYLNAIQLGHKEFDLMFERLYGVRYKENYEIFADLFRSISAYHEKGELDLEFVLNDFFEKLFVRLFRMLNPNFQFQPEYLVCISQTIKGFDGLGETPKNLLADLKKQLGATRAFVQSMFASAGIIRQLNQIDIGNSCGFELMQINYCSLCSGYVNLKPCKPNCEAAYGKCMANYEEFEKEWNKFLTMIIRFGKRLEGNLNLENTLGSMNYKISDVIMFFQENQILIRNKVFEKCSVKNVNKRSAEEDDDDESLLTVGRFKETRSKNQAISLAWRKLGEEVTKKIKKLRSYWTGLPRAICKNSNPATRCWNGTHSIALDKPARPAPDQRIQKNSKLYNSIDSLRSRLQIVNSKLSSSYNGNGLEKFDFDSQATINKGVSTEPNEEDVSDEEDRGDYEDRADFEEQMPEKEGSDPIMAPEEVEEEPNTDENQGNVVKSNPENILDNRESGQKESLERPKEQSSSSAGYLTISVCTLIISQLISRYFGNFQHL